LWTGQSNYHYDPDIPGDDFWQFNLFAGYRFPRRRAELTFGLLNLTDQDYRLNPLNLYLELPRQRTLLVSLRFNF
jgi:outer membrane receptor protein involved in Fe transport